MAFSASLYNFQSLGHGGELGNDVLSAEHSVYAGRVKVGRSPLHQAAAYPLHCSRGYLTAALNSMEECAIITKL